MRRASAATLAFDRQHVPAQLEPATSVRKYGKAE